MNQRPVPHSLEALRVRSAQPPEWLPGAETLLLGWYRGCDATAARTAARDLQLIRERTHSSDPLLLAWLGVALARGPEVQVERSEGLFLRSVYRGSNAERAGARLLAEVTERTGWVEVADELAALAFATRRPETLRLASGAIRKALVLHDDAALWTTLAEVELIRGERSAARRAADHAATAGSPRGLRVVGILGMLTEEDSGAAARSYFQGLAQAVADRDVEAFYDDIRLLLGEDELREWQGLATGRAAWLRRKWDWRAHMAGVHPDTRLAEHFRRLETATARYQQLSFRGAPPLSGIRSFTADAWRQPLDDRGLIYLRHGQPAAELRMRTPAKSEERQAVNRIAWVYHGADTRVVEFDRGADRSVYFLAEPYPICGAVDVLHPAVRFSREAYPPPGDLQDWAASLVQYQPSLARYYMACGQVARGFGIGTLPAVYLGERRFAQETADAMLNGESAGPPLAVPLDAGMNLYAFRAGHESELVGYLSVGTGALRAANAMARAGSVNLGVLFSVGEPVKEQVVQLDTVLVYSPASPLPSNATLHFVLPIRTPALGTARVTVTVTNRADDAQGQVMSTTRPLPGFTGALQLSDVVIGEPRNGALRRGTHQLAPAPGHAVLEGMPFRLYYELYGASTDATLSTTITIVPARDASLLSQLSSLIAGRRGLSVKFEEPTSPDPSGVVRSERDILAALEPGSYSVVVTLIDTRTRQAASAETHLTVLAREARPGS